MKFDPTDQDKQFIITGTEVKHTYMLNPDYKKPEKKKESWFHWSLIPVIIIVLVLFKG